MFLKVGLTKPYTLWAKLLHTAMSAVEQIKAPLPTPKENLQLKAVGGTKQRGFAKCVFDPNP